MKNWSKLTLGLVLGAASGLAAVLLVWAVALWRGDTGDQMSEPQGLASAPQAEQGAAEPQAPGEDTAAVVPEAETAPQADGDAAAEEDAAATGEDGGTAENGDTTAGEVEADATAEAVSPETGAEAAEPVSVKPGFDLVRVAPDGQALVAGTAAPGARIEVMVDSTVAAETRSDSGGRFVAMFDLAPSEQPRVMSLRSNQGDQAPSLSEESVIVAPLPGPAATEPQPEAVAEGTAEPATTESGSADVAAGGAVAPEAVAEAGVAPETGDPDAAETAAADATEPPAESAAASEPEVAEAPAEPVAEPAQEAPALLLADDQGITVLQPPSPGAAPRSVTIDTISYSDQGAVILAGRGRAGDHVRVYLNNADVATVGIGDDSQWRLELADIASGVYILRADQLNADGKVTARFETPFQREAPETLASVAPPPQPAEPGSADQPAEVAPLRASVITVQPGFTLWGIAKESYGEGILYVRLYEANKSQIRDPDLIYPGQVFSIPTEAAAE
ncbi:MAG: LysM peptidoglycan-binding domain-containing protein [Paracoccaceae bacterium]